MAQTLPVPALKYEMPDMSHIVTEDDTPVDNLFSAKQQRLLVEPLYSSWNPGRQFIADANVGVFRAVKEPPVVPDMFLSLDVSPGEDIWLKENRSYFVWKYGKAPEAAVEVVSNTEGNEKGKKFGIYARIGVMYYIIFDPQCVIQPVPLRIHELHKGGYLLRKNPYFPEIGLGISLWDGVFEGLHEEWLRWTDLNGIPVPTGSEAFGHAHRQFEQERRRAEQEYRRAEQERLRAEQERQRSERLAEKLRALGIEPD